MSRSSSSSNSDKSESSNSPKKQSPKKENEDADPVKSPSALKKIVQFDPTPSSSKTGSLLRQSTKLDRVDNPSTFRRQPTRNQSSRRSATGPRSKVDPVTLLQHKQPNFQGNFNTMAVFETLPSMYSKEKFEELQQKRRIDLPFEYLYWLSRFDPQAQDGYHLENLIDKKIEAAKEELGERINTQQTNLNKVNTKMTDFDKLVQTFRQEVVQISKLRNQMHNVADDSIALKSTVEQLEYKTGDLASKISNTSFHLDIKLGELQAKHEKLDAYAHRPNNFLQTMKQENDKLEKRLMTKIEKMSKDLAEQTDIRIEEKTLVDDWMKRQEQLQQINVEDIKLSRTDLDKAQRKFTIFEAVLSEFNVNIEALKTHALSTDLHLESTLPLQIASIAFDVGLGTIMKKQFPKYCNNFKKRIRKLEKNYQDSSDPFIVGYESMFKKNNYDLPDEYLNPTKMVQQKQSTGGDESLNDDGSPSKSKDKRRGIPKAVSRRRSSQMSAMDLTVGQLKDKAQERKRRDSKGSRRNSNASDLQDSDLPKSISKQLLETLTKWQPMDSRWTIGKLFHRVSTSVSDFLKIPMLEMNSEQFYSMYADVDNQELGYFEPLPQHTEHPEDMEGMMQQPTSQNDDSPANFTEAMPLDVPDSGAMTAPKSALKKSNAEGSGAKRVGIQSTTQIITVSSNQLPPARAQVGFKPSQTSLGENKIGLKPSQTSLGENKTTVGFSESPVSPIIKSQPPAMAMPALPQFSRMRMGGLQDPRAAKQQERLEKSAQLKEQAERRKLQEQMTSAIENIVNRVEIQEKTYQLKFKRMEESVTASTEKCQSLQRQLDEQKETHYQAIQEKDQQLRQLDDQILASRLKMKSLVGDLEESIREQIKIPQLQILHTEYARLKDVETKNVDTLLTRKAEIKAFASQNGGKMPKDDGQGVVIRKELTQCRNKLRIVRKKIKKFGELGKIPMGATHRIYHEQSESSSSSSSTTEEESDGSKSSFGSDLSRQKVKKPQKTTKKKELLASGLVYQPTFNKVVKESSNSLGKFKDMLNLQENKKKSPAGTPARQKSRENTPNLRSQFGKTSNLESVGKISEVDSISNSSFEEDSVSGNQSLRVNSRGNLIEDSDQLGRNLTSLGNQKKEGVLSFSIIPTTNAIEEQDDEEDYSPNARLKAPPLPNKKSTRSKFMSSESITQVMQSFTQVEKQDMQRKFQTASNSRATEQDNDSSSKDKEREASQFKLARQLTQQINYNSRKQSNNMLRQRKQNKKMEKYRDAEAQTDPCRFGDIQLESDSEDQVELKVNKMPKNAGTDAPTFVMLNVVEGRPDDDLLRELMSSAPIQKPSRIKNLVAEMKQDKIRKGEPVQQHRLDKVLDKFALLQGKKTQEVQLIQQQNGVNQEVYTCYQQKQDIDHFKKAIGDQKQHRQTLGVSDGTDGIASGERMQTDVMSHRSGLKSTMRSVHSKAKSVRRGGMRSNREEDIDDAKSHMTKKSRLKEKSTMSKKSRRKTVDKSEHDGSNKDLAKSMKSVGGKSKKSVGNKSQLGMSQKSKATIDKINKNIDGSAGNLSLNSSFDASYSDDDESEEDDDYVTFKEFEDYQKLADKNVKDLKVTLDKVITENVALLKKIDSVDWTVVNQAETKLSDVLGDFQMSCDGLLMSIEADIKRWKTQHAELETKNENMAFQIERLTSVSDFLREEFFGFQDENWSLQENLIKFASVQVGLAEADELDKQNISLVGQRDVADLVKSDVNHLNEEQAIGLDPTCKKCQCTTTVDRTAMLQNLKLACLMYKPNPVCVDQAGKMTKLPRFEVVEMQRQITESLHILSLNRKTRVEFFKEELKRLDEQQTSLKLTRPMSPTQSTLRYVQSSDEKTMSPLHFESLAERSKRLKIEVNSTNQSAIHSPIQSPRYTDRTVDSMNPNLQAVSSNITQIRKPILQGKIDSRAILGLKKNLNTASTFTQAQQHNNDQASLQKLFHTKSNQIRDKPGDQRYKVSTPKHLTEGINFTKTAAKASLQADFQLVSKSHLGGKGSKRIFSSNDPTQKPQTATTRAKGRTQGVSLQSLSPRAYNAVDKIQSASKKSMPLTSRGEQKAGHRFSQDINSETELPPLSNRVASANPKSSIESQTHQIGGINIKMDMMKIRNPNDYNHLQAIEQLNQASNQNLQGLRTSRNNQEVEPDSGTLRAMQPDAQTTSIKVQVRQSSTNAMQVSDNDIRSIRRNIARQRQGVVSERTSMVKSTKINSSSTISPSQ